MRTISYNSANRASRNLLIGPVLQQNYREISSRQRMTDLSKAAIGYDPKARPDYIRLYNEGCRLAESNQLVFARDKFFEALKDAIAHAEKEQVSLILAEMEQINKQIILNPDKYTSERKIKSIIPYFFCLIGGYFLRDFVPFGISPFRKSL